MQNQTEYDDIDIDEILELMDKDLHQSEDENDDKQSFELHLNSSIKRLTQSQYQKRTDITSIIFDKNVSLDKLPSFCFQGCSNLKYITFPESITKIENNVFEKCIKLQSVVLNKNIQSIGKSCFENCHSLSFISLPTSLTSISEKVFKNCTSFPFHLS